MRDDFSCETHWQLAETVYKYAISLHTRLYFYTCVTRTTVGVSGWIMTPAVTDTTVEAVSHLNTLQLAQILTDDCCFTHGTRVEDLRANAVSADARCGEAAVLPCSPWCVWYRTLCCRSCCLETGCCLQGPPHRLCGRRDIYTHCYTQGTYSCCQQEKIWTSALLCNDVTPFFLLFLLRYIEWKTLHRRQSSAFFLHKLNECSNFTRHSIDFHISVLILCPDWT